MEIIAKILSFILAIIVVVFGVIIYEMANDHDREQAREINEMSSLQAISVDKLLRGENVELKELISTEIIDYKIIEKNVSLWLKSKGFDPDDKKLSSSIRLQIELLSIKLQPIELPQPTKEGEL